MYNIRMVLHKEIYECMYVCMYVCTLAGVSGMPLMLERLYASAVILLVHGSYKGPLHTHMSIQMFIHTTCTYIHTNKHAGTDRSLELVLVQLSCHFMDVGSEQLVLLERYLVRAALALVFGPDEYVCMYACMYVYTFVYMNAYMD